MDRSIVYPGSIPLDTDVLRTNQAVMVALGAMAAAMLGSNVVVDGLACVAAGGLTVQIGQGAIFQLAPLESTAYGSLPADTRDSVVKCGINTQPTVTASLSAPGSLGQAINYLVEAQLQEQDTGAVVLPYYNAAIPAVAYSGPGGGGAAQNTLRTQRVQLQVKAGNAAATGSQATPGADASWTPLWIVTVNNGAVLLNAGNIVPHPAAPFIPTKLPMQRRRLTAPLTLYVSATGNDSNSGLTAWNAFATKQAAVNFIYNSLDCNGQPVTVSIAPGNYTDPVTLTGLPVGASAVPIAFVSQGGVVINVSNGSCFTGQQGATFSVSGDMGLYASGSGTFQGCAMISLTGAFLYVGSGVAFCACSFGHIAAAGGEVGLAGGGVSYYVAGNAPAHVIANNAGSIVTIQGATVACLTGAPYAFSGAFAVAGAGGQIVANGATFQQAAGVTGPRYAVSSGGIISTNAAGPNFFPGSVAGSGTNFGAAPYGLYQ